MPLPKKFGCGVPHNIWLTAAHIPGVSDVEADRQSQMSQSQLEWTLNPKIFQESIYALRVNPTIDLFASRINFQLQPYVSYHPDPGAVAINAFHMSWKCHLFYAFPLFCLISRVLQKIQQEKSTGLLVAPSGPHRFGGQSL